jgi:hypothetical protein
MHCRIILGSDKCGFVESQKKSGTFVPNGLFSALRCSTSYLNVERAGKHACGMQACLSRWPRAGSSE